MTSSPPLFEEMLETYPADKRELARRVYDRFADGDATEFFTQLFLLLDVYANYAKQIPLAVSETNQSTLAAMKKVREEIGLLAQNVEGRSLNVDNRFEETTERCLATQKQCEAALEKMAAMITDINRHIDTKAIADGIRYAVDAGVNKDVIKPFMQRTEELAENVVPTLDKIKEASAEAGRVWPGRIWKTALAASLVLWFCISGVVVICVSEHLETKSRRTLALEIAKEARTLQQNKDAFRDLAVANVAVKTTRVADGGVEPLPSAYALIIPGAQGAEMRGSDGYIFFGSEHPEKSLEQLQKRVIEMDEVLRKIKEDNK
jgi:hypothetical protein